MAKRAQTTPLSAHRAARHALLLLDDHLSVFQQGAAGGCEACALFVAVHQYAKQRIKTPPATTWRRSIRDHLRSAHG
jgi:hypothetical protein